MSNAQKHQGTIGENGDGRIRLFTEGLRMSPGVPKEGPVPRQIAGRIQEGLGKIKSVLEGPEISNETLGKLAVLEGKSLALGSKYNLTFDINPFLSSVVSMDEANALTRGRIKLTISGNGRTGDFSLPLEKALIWNDVITKNQGRFSDLDSMLDRSLSATIREQKGIVHPESNTGRNIPELSKMAFEELVKRMPELPLKA